jgi:hypothetical protein
MLERGELFACPVEIAADTTRTMVRPFAGKALGRALDNRAYAVANISATTQVLLFSPGNFYRQSVLNAMPNVEVNLAKDDSLTRIERKARRHDVVIFDRVQAPMLPAGNFLLLGTVPPDVGFQATGSVVQPRIQGSGDSALMRGVDLTGVRIDEALKIPIQAASPGLQRLIWSADSELALALLDPHKRMVVLGFDLNQ